MVNGVNLNLDSDVVSEDWIRHLRQRLDIWFMRNSSPFSNLIAMSLALHSAFSIMPSRPCTFFVNPGSEAFSEDFSSLTKAKC